jgi:hypothetical protein
MTAGVAAVAEVSSVLSMVIRVLKMDVPFTRISTVNIEPEAWAVVRLALTPKTVLARG